MLLRLVVALGGITFAATGISILFTDSRKSVTWGSRGIERAATSLRPATRPSLKVQ
jgi:hypothetical protein